MVLPIVLRDPEVRQKSIDDEGSFYFRVDKARQTKPYNLPLPYRLEQVRTTKAWRTETTTYGGLADVSTRGTQYLPYPNFWEDNSLSELGRMRTAINNRLRAKLIDKIGERAENAVNYAERRQAYGMILKRVATLTQLVRSIKRGDTRRALKILGRRLPKRKTPIGKRVKSSADLWLEFHFGWEPLVKDIYRSVNVLQGPVPGGRIFVSRQENETFRRVQKPYSGLTITESLNCTIRHSAGCYVHVDNPDLWLANQLGLINPASVAWELVPFSFVVDWYIPVGAFLSQMTDFAGLRIRDPWQSEKCNGNGFYYYKEIYGGKLYQRYIERESLLFRRTLSLPEVKLTRSVPLFKGFSPSRGATAISLLVQQLRSLR